METSSGVNALHASINVTPLVDVCLVLLIIFLVVTPMLRDEVLLPRTPAPAAEPRDKGDVEITVAMDPPGYKLGGESVSLTLLADRLAEFHERDPLRKVRLRADRRLTWGDVRPIMEVVARSGYETAGIIAEKKDATGEGRTP